MGERGREGGGGGGVKHIWPRFVKKVSTRE